MPWLTGEKAILTVFILILLSLAAFGNIAAGPQEERAFQRAAALYQADDYAGAARVYEGMIRKGQASGAVYYNLGNCYFKAGELGRAILQYERARRLMPRDPSLRANHAYALKAAGVDNSPKRLANKILAAVTGLITTSALAWLAWGVFLALLLALNLRLLMRHRALNGRAPKRLWLDRCRQLGLVLAAAFAILGLFAFWTIYRLESKEQGIVVAEEAAVRYEPNESGTVFFSLKEGSLVGLERKDGEWILIQRLDGRKGWTERKSVEKI